MFSFKAIVFSRLARIVSVSLASVAFGQEVERVTVCNLVDKISVFDGKMVTVRAPVLAGGESLDLLGEHCSTQLVIKGYHFPQRITLTAPGSPKLLVHHVDFALDERSRGEFSASLRGLDRKKQRIRASFTGLFETRSDLERLVLIRPTGVAPMGFGHLGATPGQLIMKDIRDIVVEPIPRDQ